MRYFPHGVRRYPQCRGREESWLASENEGQRLRAICDALQPVLTRAYIGGEVLEPKAQPVSLPRTIEDEGLKPAR